MNEDGFAWLLDVYEHVIEGEFIVVCIPVFDGSGEMTAIEVVKIPFDQGKQLPLFELIDD